MISKYINYFKSQNGCVTFDAAPDEEIERVNAKLVADGFSDIPEEYKIFLKLTNGLTYNGAELYGTSPHYRIDKNYTFPDIVSESSQYIDYEFFAQKVVFGRISEHILLYDKKNDYYAIVDRTNLRSRIEVENFVDFIKVFYDISTRNYNSKK